MNVSEKLYRRILTAIFAAIIVIMTFVPYLGYIPLGVINATLIHIPVIIGAILLGPKTGAVLGLIFGLSSLVKNTFQPNLTSFCFSPFYNDGNLWSLVICLVPRMLIGIVSYYVFCGGYRLFARGRKKKLGEMISLVVAGAAGSMTNTLLVMHLIYLFFGDLYGEVTGKATYAAILAVIGTSGVGEAIVAAILVAAICKVMLHIPAIRNGISTHQ